MIKEWAEHQFELEKYKTGFSTELVAGATTFATMAYVLAVVPGMMKGAGLSPGAVLTAMVLMIFITTMAMAFYTNRPFVLAPGLGSVAIFSITMVQLQQIPVEIAAGLVFLSGLLFLAVTLLGIRDAVVSVIPRGIKISISAGVGLFIAAIGLRNAHIIAADAKKIALSFGDLSQPAVWTAAAGMILLLVLQSRHVKGGALLAILGGTLLGIPLGVTHFPQTFFSVPEGVGSIFMRFDIMGALSLQYVPYLFAFFLPDFFSSLGTALGVGGRAGFLDSNGDLPGLHKIFLVDSLAAMVGSFLTIPVLITYLESSAGVESGGRTGLTAAAAAVLFLLVLAVTPLALMIPAAATSPVLIYVGVSMMKGLKNLNYEELSEYVPAFLCIALSVFTFNVGNGIAAAFIAYVIIRLAQGEYRSLKAGHYLLALVLSYYFYALAFLK